MKVMLIKAKSNALKNTSNFLGYSGGGFKFSLLFSFSFLNSNLPNFQVKLIPTDLKGTLRRLLVTKPGPKRSVCWLTYLLKKLFAVRAILAFLFHSNFLTARLYDVKEG